MSKKKPTGQFLVIQIDRDVLRAAQTTLGAAEPELKNPVTAALPEGAVEDGAILDPEAVRQALEQAIAQTQENLNIRKMKGALLVLSSTQIISATAVVPDMKAKQTEKIIKANADLYIPVDLRGYRLVWMRVGAAEEKDGQAMQTVRIWAVPTAMLQPYYSLVNGVGLPVAQVACCESAMAAAAGAGYALPASPKKKEAANEQAPTDEPQDTQLFITVGAEHLLMTFVRGGQVQLQRLLLRGDTTADDLSEARIVLDYYNTTQGAGETIRITVCGAPAVDVDYIRQLEQTFGQRADVWSAQPGPEWCLCLGAGRGQPDFGDSELNRVKRRAGLSQAWQYAAVLVGGVLLTGSLVASFGYRAMWTSTLNILESEQRSAQVQALETAGYADNYNSYAEAYASYSADWDNIFQSLRTYNNNLVLMFDELEEILPSQTSVVSIGIANEGLGLQFRCSTKEEAAYLIMALRDLEYATLDAISSITMSAGEGSSGQDMLPSLAARLAEEMEEEPEEGSSYAISEASNLRYILLQLSEEEILALESVYGSPPATDDSLDELLTLAAQTQRAAALETLLTNDEIGRILFEKALMEDFGQDAADRILIQRVLYALAMADDTQAREEESGDAEESKDAEQAGDAEEAAVDPLVEILTSSAANLAAAERLIAQSEALNARYMYALAVEAGLRSETDGTGELNYDAILADLLSGAETEIPALAPLKAALDAAIVEGAIGGEEGEQDPAPSEDGNVDDAAESPADPAEDNETNETAENGDSSAAGSSSDNAGMVYGSAGNPSGATDDEIRQLLQQLESMGTQSDSSGGSAEETAVSAGDGYYYFSVALGYKDSLIQAELERKGLSEALKVDELEVTP